MKPSRLGLDEIQPDDLLLLDYAGEVLAGRHPRHDEFPIHAEVFRARPEVMCVVHTHPPYSIAFAARGGRLRPVSHEGSFFWPPGVPTYTASSDLIRTKAQGETLARVLGAARAIFLRNHGIAVVGGSIAEAAYAAILLERAAELQLLAQPSPDARVHHTSEDEARRKREIFYPGAIRASFEYLARKHGLVDR